MCLANVAQWEGIATIGFESPSRRCAESASQQATGVSGFSIARFIAWPTSGTVADRAPIHQWRGKDIDGRARSWVISKNDETSADLMTPPAPPSMLTALISICL